MKQESESELEALETQLKQAKDHMQRIELQAEINQLETDIRVKQKALALLAPSPPDSPSPAAATAPTANPLDEELFARMRARFGAGWADGRGGNGGR